MNKKWLCGVALGTLLVAGNAVGITVQDVLNHDFFAPEHRGTYEYVYDGSKTCHIKEKKSKTVGNTHTYLSIERGKWLPPEKIKWRYKALCADTEELDDDHYMYNTERETILKVSRPGLKEKTEGQDSSFEVDNFNDRDSYIGQRTITNNYTNKHRKRQPQPLGPMVSDFTLLDFVDWPDDFLEIQFYGTEKNSVTNIISDHEAYITRTVTQIGFLEKFGGTPVNVTSSVHQVYDQHIMTDGDRVHINQTITETSQNTPESDRQYIYKTDYAATFKKGRCVQETERLEESGEIRLSEWFKEYLKSRANSIETTSINAQPTLKAKHTRLARTTTSNQRSQ